MVADDDESEGSASTDSLPHPRLLPRHSSGDLYEHHPPHADDATAPLEQLAYMEHMYNTIQALNAELENERQERAQLVALTNSFGDGDMEPDVRLVMEQPPPLLRPQPPLKRSTVLPPPSSPRSNAPGLSNDQIELCATLGKNAELRIRTKELAKSAETTAHQLAQTHKQMKAIERRVATRDEKLRWLLKEKLQWQLELKDARAHVVEEKMRQVELLRRLETAKRESAAQLALAEQDALALLDENQRLRSQVADASALVASQTKQLEDVTRQARDEREKLVACVAETRSRFAEWKERESAAMRTAREQAVTSIRTECELKLARHQDEKQKLREKVQDLEVALRLVAQTDRALSPLELSLRKATILASKSGSGGTSESDVIEARARVRELEALLAHAHAFQQRQESVLKVSEATVSRLVQEREVAALEHLSMQQLAGPSAVYAPPDALSYSSPSSSLSVSRQRDAPKRQAYASDKGPVSPLHNGSAQAKPKTSASNSATKTQPAASSPLLSTRQGEDAALSATASGSMASTFSLVTAAPPSKLSRLSVGDERFLGGSQRRPTTPRQDTGIHIEAKAPVELAPAEPIAEETGECVPPQQDRGPLRVALSESEGTTMNPNKQVLAIEVARLQKELADLKAVVSSRLGVCATASPESSDSLDVVTVDDTGLAIVRTDGASSASESEDGDVGEIESTADEEVELERTQSQVAEQRSLVADADTARCVAPTDGVKEDGDGAPGAVAPDALHAALNVERAGVADACPASGCDDTGETREAKSSREDGPTEQTLISVDDADPVAGGVRSTTPVAPVYGELSLVEQRHARIDDAHASSAVETQYEPSDASGATLLSTDTQPLVSVDVPTHDSDASMEVANCFASADGATDSVTTASGSCVHEPAVVDNREADTDDSSASVSDVVSAHDSTESVANGPESADSADEATAFDREAKRSSEDCEERASGARATQFCGDDNMPEPRCDGTDARLLDETRADECEATGPNTVNDRDDLVDWDTPPVATSEKDNGSTPVNELSVLGRQQEQSLEEPTVAVEVSDASQIPRATGTQTIGSASEAEADESCQQRGPAEPKQWLSDGGPVNTFETSGAANRGPARVSSAGSNEIPDIDPVCEASVLFKPVTSEEEQSICSSILSADKPTDTSEREHDTRASDENSALRAAVSFIAANTVVGSIHKGLLQSLVRHQELRQHVSKALVANILHEAVTLIARESQQQQRTARLPLALAFDSQRSGVAETPAVVLLEEASSLLPSYAETSEDESGRAFEAGVTSECGVDASLEQQNAAIEEAVVDDAESRDGRDDVSLADVSGDTVETFCSQLPAQEETQHTLKSADASCSAAALRAETLSTEDDAPATPLATPPSLLHTSCDNLDDVETGHASNQLHPLHGSLEADGDSVVVAVAAKVVAAYAVQTAIRRGLHHSLVLHDQQRKFVAKTFVMSILRSALATVLEQFHVVRSATPQVYNELGNLLPRTCDEADDDVTDAKLKWDASVLVMNYSNGVLSPGELDEVGGTTQLPETENMLQGDTVQQVSVNSDHERPSWTFTESNDVQNRRAESEEHVKSVIEAAPASGNAVANQSQDDTYGDDVLTVATKSRDRSEPVCSTDSDDHLSVQGKFRAAEFVAGIETEALRSVSASIVQQRLASVTRTRDCSDSFGDGEPDRVDDEDTSACDTRSAFDHTVTLADAAVVTVCSVQLNTPEAAPEDTVPMKLSTEVDDRQVAASVEELRSSVERSEDNAGREVLSQPEMVVEEAAVCSIEEEARPRTAQCLVDDVVLVSAQLSIQVTARALGAYAAVCRPPVGDVSGAEVLLAPARHESELNSDGSEYNAGNALAASEAESVGSNSGRALGATPLGAKPSTGVISAIQDELSGTAAEFKTVSDANTIVDKTTDDPRHTEPSSDDVENTVDADTATSEPSLCGHVLDELVASVEHSAASYGGLSDPSVSTSAVGHTQADPAPVYSSPLCDRPERESSECSVCPVELSPGLKLEPSLPLLSAEGVPCDLLRDTETVTSLADISSDSQANETCECLAKVDPDVSVDLESVSAAASRAHYSVEQACQDREEVVAALNALLNEVERAAVPIDPMQTSRPKVKWALAHEEEESAAERVPKLPSRRTERRRTSRRLYDASHVATTELMRDPTLAAYDAHHEQSQPFALLDANILTIDPHARHMHFDENDQAKSTDSEIRAKRKNLDHDNHRKSIAYRSIPAFNYAPVLIRFQWSDFVVATPLSISGLSSAPGDKKAWNPASPVKNMRLLVKKGIKLSCGSYVIISAFIRPLEDGNENLRIHIYDSEWVEEFQYDFSEDHLKAYMADWAGCDDGAKQFIAKLEFRREEGGIIIRLPDKTGAGDGQEEDEKRPTTAPSPIAATHPDGKERPHDRPLPPHRGSRHSQRPSTGTLSAFQPARSLPNVSGTASTLEPQPVPRGGEPGDTTSSGAVV